MGLRGGAEGLLEDEEEVLVAKISKMGHGDNSKGNVNMVMVGHVDAGKSTISGYVCKKTRDELLPCNVCRHLCICETVCGSDCVSHVNVSTGTYYT